MHTTQGKTLEMAMVVLFVYSDVPQDSKCRNMSSLLAPYCLTSNHSQCSSLPDLIFKG